MQKLQLIGNLAADATQVQGKDGREPFISFTLACNEKKGDQEVTTWYEATYKSTGAFQFLKQGKKVYIEGTPECRSYLTKDNTPAARIIVRVHNLELL